MAGLTEVNTKRGPRLSLPPPETAPWLVFPCGNTRKMQTFCSVLEGESKKYYVQSIPELRKKECWVVNHGWLLMFDMYNKEYYGFTLFNPVSLETIQLPDLMLNRITRFCFLSSIPTDPDCLVLIFCETPSLIIYYCHPRDEKWSKQPYDLPKRNDIISEAIGIPDGSGTTTIYVRIWSDLAVLDRDPSGGLSVRMLNVKKPNYLSDTLRYATYSVESGGELFHVRVHYVWFVLHEVKYIEVFKMDFSDMVWVKVEDLGDRVFFLGKPGYTLSCIANPELGIKGNHIYFTLPEDNHLYVFSLKDEDISCSLPCPDLKTPWYKPYWIMPAANRAVGMRSDECSGRILVDDVNVVPQSNKAMLDEENEPIETQLSLFTCLPKELQFYIATHIKSAADYTSFRTTCKTFRLLAPPIQWRSALTRSVTPAVQSPWLMFFQQEVCCFLEPNNNMVYCKKTPKGLIGARIRCSKHGWLLMSRGTHSMFFYDPFSEAKIELPDMRYRCQSIGFSSPPTSSDFMIFAISRDWICFFSLGQERWSRITLEMDVKKPFLPSNSCPVFYNGNFYCLSLDGRGGVFKEMDGLWNWELASNLERPCRSSRHYYLIEYDGVLFSLFVGQNGKSVHVFSLDSDMNAWTRVMSLEDRILYISRTSSLAVTTLEKRKHNRIFFPRVCGDMNNAVGVFYSLETGGFHSSFSGGSLQEKKEEYFGKDKLHCTWIQPNVVWTIKGRCACIGSLTK